MAGYREYLELDKLLSLQRPRTSDHHTELPFIVVHQVYELWFKVVIHDLGAAVAAVDGDELPTALRHLRRVHQVERLMVEQMTLIDQLAPGAFAALRPALGTASAAESRQFARIEALSAPQAGNGEAPRDLWTALCARVQRRGGDMPVGEDADTRWRRTQTLVDIYRVGDGWEVDLCEAFLDHDHALCTWRHRHCLGAARQIGDRRGTGGTSGVAYLEQRVNRRFYPELWAARSAATSWQLSESPARPAVPPGSS